MQFADTIAAVATAPGRGAVGVVRISGPHALTIARRMGGPLPPPRQAGLRNLRDARGADLDQSLVLVFPAPHSYTGENVVEFQAHGGPVLLDLLLRALIEMGARLARPGEFSERAFLNGRIDLTQAEAIADLIDASSAQAVRAARRGLAGELSARVGTLVEQLIGLRTFVEAALDFSDEDIEWLGGGEMQQRLDQATTALDELLAQCAQGRRLREGMVVALAGQPNVGKSTLLNRLAGAEVAIVTDIAGTTRDLLREQIVLDGLPLLVIDTAGLRDSDDPVEAEGIRRAWTTLADAELALFLVDDQHGIQPADEALLSRLPAQAGLLVVHNKCDLSGNPPGLFERQGRQHLRLSAVTGSGLNLLRQHLVQRAGLQAQPEGLFSARSRHIEALQRARGHLETARSHMAEKTAPELTAEELRLAQQALAQITGEFSSDDLLGRIFGSFCIGK